MTDIAFLVGLFVALIFGVLAIVCGRLNARARDEDRESWEPGYRGKG